MRALLAGIFVFAVLLTTVGIISKHYPRGDLPWWGVPTIIGSMFAAIIASLFVFNKSGYRPNLSGKSFEEQLAELQQKGLLINESFKARRAFQVEEFEDEGSHYFIELVDGGVLFLSGQYLYDYAEITDDPELNQNRKFPCTEFTLQRHKDAGYVVNIVCAGQVLPIECVTPPFDKNAFKRGLVPEDGQVVRNRSYEDLKWELLKPERDR
jgi:hypothetical protein